MIKNIIFILCLLFSCPLMTNGQDIVIVGPAAVAREYRVWTNTQGKTITAVMVDANIDRWSVTLAKKNSIKLYTISMDTLSEEDIQYILQAMRKRVRNVEYRNWELATGDEITASMLLYLSDKDTVVLRKKDGTYTVIDGSRFSDVDTRWLHNYQTMRERPKQEPSLAMASPRPRTTSRNMVSRRTASGRRASTSSYTYTPRYDQPQYASHFSGGSGSGIVHVRAYRRKDGTYVRAHTRSKPRR